MTVTNFDWAIIFGFFALTLAIGFIVAKSASKSEKDFFLGGGKMPWWLLAFSMVATTFSTDTPNFVANLIRSEHGVMSNWSWWCFLLTGMLTVFIYAGLWRRSNAITDLEFYELRYSGKPAAFLRGFRALYLGIVFNVLIMGTVSVAAIKIGGIVLGLEPWESILYALIVTVIFSSLGGFKGVIITDCILFVMAMVGSFVVAYYAVSGDDVGGLSGMVEKISNNPEIASKLDFFPDLTNKDAFLSTVVPVLIIPLVVQWWSAWFPGAEPGGGGYLAQRMLAAKDEKSAISATLFFNVAHYALRPWPWIIVGLASLIVFPLDSDAVREQAAKDEKVYRIEYQAMTDELKKSPAGKALEEKIKVADEASRGLTSLRKSYPDYKGHLAHDASYSAMLKRVPNKGWLGLILASLIAAYMSTISTHLNWGSSYIVNDFYQRFIKQDASQKELVWVGRLSTVLLMIATALVALCLKSAKEAFDIIIMMGAGTGLLFILRWFWWRINSFSEITAMVVSFVTSLFFHITRNLLEVESFANFPKIQKMLIELKGMAGWEAILWTVGITTVGWIVVTLVTPRDSDEILERFCTKINAGGIGWNKIIKNAEAQGRAIVPEHKAQNIGLGIVCMIFACAGVYTALFSAGSFIYGKMGQGAILAVVSAVTIFLMFYFWNMKTTKEAANNK
ncbi:sodium:solute symporter family protein [Lentisphaerota bacterium WC36G]|nr:Na+:solute symporter [Lentisphaerae bacterium WC36]